MSTDSAVFPDRRWPRIGLAAILCAALVALGLLACPGARAAHAAVGPVPSHRPVGKVLITSDPSGAAGTVWNHTPDQDVAVEHRAITTVQRTAAGPARVGIKTRTGVTVHSRGPPGSAG